MSLSSSINVCVCVCVIFWVSSYLVFCLCSCLQHAFRRGLCCNCDDIDSRRCCCHPLRLSFCDSRFCYLHSIYPHAHTCGQTRNKAIKLQFLPPSKLIYCIFCFSIQNSFQFPTCTLSLFTIDKQCGRSPNLCAFFIISV